MRNQRRAGVTVVIERSRVVVDALGDETSDSKSQTVHGCQWSPDHDLTSARSNERPGNDQVRVVNTGSMNIPGCHQLVADDFVRFFGDRWQVVGNGLVWRDRTKVRLQRARAK